MKHSFTTKYEIGDRVAYNGDGFRVPRVFTGTIVGLEYHLKKNEEFFYYLIEDDEGIDFVKGISIVSKLKEEKK